MTPGPKISVKRFVGVRGGVRSAYLSDDHRLASIYQQLLDQSIPGNLNSLGEDREEVFAVAQVGNYRRRVWTALSSWLKNPRASTRNAADENPGGILTGPVAKFLPGEPSNNQPSRDLLTRTSCADI